jgi:hypothetical protein
MTTDSARRISNRRQIIASLRASADTAEETAAELRDRADRMEQSTDALEGKHPAIDTENCARRLVEHEEWRER